MLLYVSYRRIALTVGQGKLPVASCEEAIH
jgi:hypothetical protein